MLSNFEGEIVAILSNSKTQPKNGFAYKKTCSFLKKEIQLINVVTKTVDIAIDNLTFKSSLKNICK